MAAEHGRHLVGRAGEHEDVDAAALKGAAGSGAHGIVKDHAVLGQLRLLGVVLRHGDMEGRLVKGADLLQNLRVKYQFFPKGLTDGLLCQIVVGGSQAPCGDDDVRPAAGGLHGLFQALRVVAHHGVPEDVDPQGGQTLGDGLGVGVDNIT